MENQNGRLNIFLVFFLIVNVIRSFIGAIKLIVIYGTPIIIGYNPTVWGHKEYFGLFCSLSVLFVVIHIAGLIIILMKKTIVGVYVILGNILFAIFVSILMNAIFNYEIFNLTATITNGIVQLIIIPILLLLKSHGKSAWSLLLENHRKK